MKRTTTFIISCITVLLLTTCVWGQESDRTPLIGQVIYLNVNVPNVNVINVTAETIVTTNADGEFVTDVKIGDQLAFSSINYELTAVEITQQIIDDGRLVIEVNEKVNELEEVVVTTENKEKFLNAKSEEMSAHGKYQYERDDATQLNNPTLPTQVRGLQNGLNIKNLIRLLVKKRDKDDEANKKQLALSEILQQVYSKDFFVNDLKIKEENIEEFLFYLDDQPFSRDLLKKDQEFLFVDYLVNQSKAYNSKLADNKN